MSIVACVAEIDASDDFWPDFCRFYARNEQKHSLDLFHAKREPYHKVLSRAVEYAKETQATHILFVEDDHWRFRPGILDDLLSADKDLIAPASFQRRNPMRSSACRKKYPEKSLLDPSSSPLPLFSKRGMDPVQQCDLIGLYFTLVKMSIIEKFQVNPFHAWDDNSPDSHLCQAVADVGGTCWVHFGYSLAHGHMPMTPENRRESHNGLIAIHRQQKLMEQKDERAEREFLESQTGL